MFVNVGDRAGRRSRSAIVMLADIVTSGSQSSVTISQIPQTYRDLLIVVTGRNTNAALDQQLAIQFNGDTGSNYNYTNTYIQNGGAGAVGSTGDTKILTAFIPGASATANYAGHAEIVVPNYASTVFYKQTSSKGGEAKSSALVNHNGQIGHGNWLNTAAVMSMTVAFDVGNFVDGSVVTVYGIGGPACALAT